MADTEVQVEVQLENSASGQHAFEDMKEVEEPLLLLADVALATPCDDHVLCSWLEVSLTERSIQSLQLQLQFLMHKADDLHDYFVNQQGNPEREALAAAVSNFLYKCQPYFNHLETTARITTTQNTHPPVDICTKLLDFSQQLCDRLEQLLLTFASYNLLCLDETQPNSVSHFCIGQRQLSQLRLTIFRYCKPIPYLAQANTGLHKRMRWNVERLRDEPQQKDKTVGDADYYFLCYEDIPNSRADADRDSQGVSLDNVVRMWSIGQWVQVNPDPNTEDIYDWIMCEVPQASYHRLLFLGSDEPSSCSATDYLQQLLLSHQTTDECNTLQ